jgi:hypothetical protein
VTGIDPEKLDPGDLSHIDDYLGWQPVAHADGCRETGWLVRSYERESHRSGPIPIGMRASCPSCGASHELITMTQFQDQWGDVRGPWLRSDLRPFRGHATRPVKVMGHWLHAQGRRVSAGEGFWDYYLTASADQPSSVAEILGAVTLVQNRQRHWRYAAFTVDRAADSLTRFGLTAQEQAPKKFTTPLAAARWIVRTLQASEADSST